MWEEDGKATLRKYSYISLLGDIEEIIYILTISNRIIHYFLKCKVCSFDNQSKV